MSFKDPDPRKDPNFKNLDADEKYDLMEKFMEAKDQAFEQIFNEQKKEVEEAKSEAKEAKAAQAAAEPLPRNNIRLTTKKSVYDGSKALS